MLSKLRPRSIYDVMAAIACFVALAGGTAYAADTIGTSDIIDNQVFTTDVRDDNLGFGGLTHPDLGTGSVRSSEVLNNSLTGNDITADAIDSDEIVNGALNDEDISEATAVDFTVNVGTVGNNGCVIGQLLTSVVDAGDDHLLLTPEFDSASGLLVYSAYYAGADRMWLQVCNPTRNDINDGTSRFNLLVIDAH
jgi:hypothetical protein